MEELVPVLRRRADDHLDVHAREGKPENEEDPREVGGGEADLEPLGLEPEQEEERHQLKVGVELVLRLGNRVPVDKERHARPGDKETGEGDILELDLILGGLELLEGERERRVLNEPLDQRLRGCGRAERCQVDLEAEEIDAVDTDKGRADDHGVLKLSHPDHASEVSVDDAGVVLLPLVHEENSLGKNRQEHEGPRAEPEDMPHGDEEGQEGDRVAAVVEELAERRARAGLSRLLPVARVESLIEEIRDRAEVEHPARDVADECGVESNK